VDFIHLRLKEGIPLEQAVVDAGAVRFRPMLLTAAAVVVGATVILFDPILYFLLARRQHLDEEARHDQSA
jgi:multidrug efflux pump subunit AcrB